MKEVKNNATEAQFAIMFQRITSKFISASAEAEFAKLISYIPDVGTIDTAEHRPQEIRNKEVDSDGEAYPELIPESEDSESDRELGSRRGMDPRNSSGSSSSSSSSSIEDEDNEKKERLRRMKEEAQRTEEKKELKLSKKRLRKEEKHKELDRQLKEKEDRLAALRKESDSDESDHKKVHRRSKSKTQPPLQLATEKLSIEAAKLIPTEQL
jgi:hypothetical protein